MYFTLIFSAINLVFTNTSPLLVIIPDPVQRGLPLTHSSFPTSQYITLVLKCSVPVARLWFYDKQ